MKLKSCILLLTLLPLIMGRRIILAEPSPRFGGYATVGKSEVEGNSSGIDDNNFSAGIQMMNYFGFPVLLGYGYGLDMGYTRLYPDNKSGPITEYAKVLPCIELVLTIFTLQAGAGPYYVKGDKICPGIMFNWGFTLPVDPFFIQLLGKKEWIQGDEHISTLGFQLGFYYLFD